MNNIDWSDEEWLEVMKEFPPDESVEIAWEYVENLRRNEEDYSEMFKRRPQNFVGEDADKIDKLLGKDENEKSEDLV